MSRLAHSEVHMVHRIGWLRAAVMGANDGLVSTASLVVGVAAAGSGHPEVLIAGLAGLVAGAMSMAAGEYVSVSSQTDAEQADIARETRELRETPEAELEELTRIYRARGLDEDAGPAGRGPADGARRAGRARPRRARDFRNGDGPSDPGRRRLRAHLRGRRRVPLIVALLAPTAQIGLVVAGTALVALAVLGGLGASAGGAGILKGAVRVTFWGALAMAATAGVGTMFGVAA